MTRWLMARRMSKIAARLWMSLLMDWTSTLALAALAMIPATGCADDIGPKAEFEEQRVEFENHGVRLAGSLLLPLGEAKTPAVVFVHGAGRQTRESFREVATHFAVRGIAALIYDKRGTGKSGGDYESREPYTNLVNDCLAAVGFLQQHRSVDPEKIGLWGLSQGATICGTAASRTTDIPFVIVIGADVADGSLFQYRDNLFRKSGLSARLRDVAEKFHMVDQDLQNTFRNGFRLSLLTPRTYPSPDQFVHPAWSRVNQPVLAMWGEQDQNIAVAESVAGLKNSLAQANNRNWTILIEPGTNHDLKIAAAGEPATGPRGYPAGALATMTDWAWTVLQHPETIPPGQQSGNPPEAGVLSRLVGYERLRWFGNGVVQAGLWMFFLIRFGVDVFGSLSQLVMGRLRRSPPVAVSAPNRLRDFTRAIGTLNALILVGFSITAVLVVDQLHPRCPFLLRFVPLLGFASTLATVWLLIRVVRTPGNQSSDPPAQRSGRFSWDLLCLILFVPYMLYWNLIGTTF